jgi:hypothetical protein
MYESGKQDVQLKDGIEVEATFVHANLFKVQADTNCPKGGDAGHGGMTTVTLTDLGGSCIDIDVDGDLYDSPEMLTITVHGDAEMVTLADALEFAAKSLKEQAKKNSETLKAASVKS